MPAASAAVKVPLDAGAAQQAGSDSLFALWHALLWRYTGQAEIAVGFVEHDGVRTSVVNFDAGISFKQVAAQARAARDAAEEFPVGAVSMAAGFSAMSDSAGMDGFRLLLRIPETEPGAAELWYDPARMSADAVERLARGYAAMLSGLAGNPDAAVDSLPALGPEDLEEVTQAFNRSAAPYPARCVHELFEEQVRRTPENLALRFHEQTFTYQQLNARANRLAHALIARGAGPNVPVALFVERSAEMIVGLLAIMKAGGCYVPLVHDDPAARISHLLGETRPPALLTSAALAPRLPDYAGAIVLFEDPLEAEPETDPGPNAKPSDLCCIIYTSGSTGAPKGVAARHSNLANYIQFIRARLDLAHQSEPWHFATVSTISAILGNTGVFGALMSGGCLHVIDYETAMAPNLFADYFEKHPIDVMKIAPSQMSALLAGSGGRSVLPSKYIVIGGEMFTWELLEQIRAHGSCQAMNHYGPTETMGCCTFVVGESEFEGWRPDSVPLGRPMANQQLYILDSHLRPVPIGAPGELCMSGAGLTEGYFNQPQQTAERFVQHPFSTEPGARIYRTGDRARFLPGGFIEFLGRIDHQVKIRGFRVEPAEVEAVLKKYPDVRQAVVVPEDGPSGEKILAAYVVAAEGTQHASLREFLRDELPEYMVPSRLLTLAVLPLNRNGKLDLPALAALSDPEQKIERPVDVPRSAAEEQVLAIWVEVLKQPRIGIHDDFFDLGGHSLLAMQILARVRNTFGVQIPLFGFFESPTVADLTAKVAELVPEGAPNGDADMESLLKKLEGMSEEEAEALLAAELKTDPNAAD
jgi:amino acid adenylation domain-containing protein